MNPRSLQMFPLLLVSAIAAAASPSPDSKPIRVILVGDSTMAGNSGYGDALCRRFRPEVACINLARGGRSSASFRAEGRWDEVQALLRDGARYSASYVLVQFGHNDQPGKPGRSTDLVHQFPANMERYAAEAGALGAVPVLVTPLTRRSFRGAYVHDDLAPWSAAVRRAARAQSAALLDLNAISLAAVAAMGEEQAETLARAPRLPSMPPPSTAGGSEPQGAPANGFDRTHVGARGAALFADMVADELRRLFPAIAPAFKSAP